MGESRAGSALTASTEVAVIAGMSGLPFHLEYPTHRAKECHKMILKAN